MLSVSRGSIRRIGPLRYFGHLLGCMVLQGILRKSPLLSLLLLRIVWRIGYVCMSWPRILRLINTYAASHLPACLECIGCGLCAEAADQF